MNNNKQCGDKKFISKKEAAEKWCKDNGYNFIIADEDYFISMGIPDDLSGFDDKSIGKN